MTFKAAESVSFRNYCMWIFSTTVQFIPKDKPFYEFWLLAFVRNITFSVTFYSLYNSVTEEIRTAMSIKRQFMHFKWLKGEIPAIFITCILRNNHVFSNNIYSVSLRLADLWSEFLYIYISWRIIIKLIRRKLLFPCHVFTSNGNVVVTHEIITF